MTLPLRTEVEALIGQFNTSLRIGTGRQLFARCHKNVVGFTLVFSKFILKLDGFVPRSIKIL